MIGGTPAPINDKIDSVIIAEAQIYVACTVSGASVLGNIMADGRTLFQIKPYIIFFPAVFLSLTVLAVNLLGDGFRDVLDPRKSKSA